MTRESFSARLMRMYSRWRGALFAMLAMLGFVMCLSVYWPKEDRSGDKVLAGRWSDSSSRPWDTGGWLNFLFDIRSGLYLATRRADPVDVVIVGFDKTFDAESYKAEAATNEALRDYVSVKGTAFDRSVHARMLDRLVAAGARMVVFDFFFEGEGVSPAGDKALADAIARHREKVVIGCKFSFVERPVQEGRSAKQFALVDPYESLIPDERPAEVMGFVDVWPDEQGKITLMKHAESQLSLSSPELSDKIKDWEYSLAGRAVKKLGLPIPEDNRARLINFAGPAKTIETYPAIDLLAEREWASLVKRGAFKDKVVVVGPYSEIHYKDAFVTPYGMMLGLEIQANCVRTLLRTAWIDRVAPTLGGSVALCGLVGFVTWLADARVKTRRGSRRLAIILFPSASYLVAAVFLFTSANLFLPPAPLAYSLVLGLVYVLFDYIHAQYEKSRIKGMFGTYLSPTIVNRMVSSGEEPKLGGEQVSLTAFFSDVQSFSSFSEILTPEQLVAIMNEYLGAMTEILEEDAGTLDKYIGDAIVAMFGAPLHLEDHAHRACACALRMQKRMAELRAEWASQGDKWPKKIHAMRVRIGLNTGPATVGNMGSAKRFNYTMMGDTVNLAARCESGAKSAGVYTLVSGETAEAARAAPGDVILFRKVDLWRVKGRSTAVTMYEVVDFEDAASAETKECVRLYEAALELYFQRKFTEAKALFEQSRALEPLQPGRDPGVEHTASEIMSERCDDMLATPPPADWDGVYVMKGK